VMIMVMILIISVSAVSDFLMAFYLLVIGIQDCQFRGNYHKEAHKWMSSWGCTLIGMVAMTSSEVSLSLEFRNHRRKITKTNERGKYIGIYQTLKICLSRQCIPVRAVTYQTFRLPQMCVSSRTG
jgi:hypothetical protein